MRQLLYPRFRSCLAGWLRLSTVVDMLYWIWLRSVAVKAESGNGPVSWMTSQCITILQHCLFFPTCVGVDVRLSRCFRALTKQLERTIRQCGSTAALVASVALYQARRQHVKANYQRCPSPSMSWPQGSSVQRQKAYSIANGYSAYSSPRRSSRIKRPEQEQGLSHTLTS